MIVAELAVAIGSEDNGTWSSGHYFELPDDTPEDEVAETAIRMFFADLPYQERELVQQVWLYSWERPEEEAEESDNDD